MATTQGKGVLYMLWTRYLLGLKVVAASLLAGIVIVTLINVTMRYVFKNAIVWAEEVGQLGFILLSFLAAALAVAYNQHLALKGLAQRFAPRTMKGLSALYSGLVLTFFGVLFKGGLDFVRLTGAQRTSGLQLPLAWIYAVIPISAVLMAISYLGARRYPDTPMTGATSPKTSPDDSSEGEESLLDAAR